MQLLALQQFIFACPEADRHPSQQEINMQTKLLTNIIRIQKFNATDLAIKNMNAFLRFLAKEDKQLSKTIAGKYAQFMGAAITPDCTTEPAEPLQPAQHGVMQSPAATGTEEMANHLRTESINELTTPAAKTPTAEEKEQYLLDPPPFSENDFNIYKHLLANYEEGDRDTLQQIGDRQFNKRWPEHNLLQYTLLKAERRFEADADRLRKLIDYADTKRMIRKHLASIAS